MEHIELQETIRTLVDSFAAADPDQDWRSVIHLLDYGQEDEAMDVVIATLVRFNVPIKSAERDTLRRLMGEFEFTEESRQYYRYLSDAEMLDRMTVVDEPSS